MSLVFAECNDIADCSYISDFNSDSGYDSISASVVDMDSSSDLNLEVSNTQSDDLELENSELVDEDLNSDDSKAKADSKSNALKSNALGSSSDDIISSPVAIPSVLSASNYVIIEDESHYGSSANPSIQSIINEAGDIYESISNKASKCIMVRRLRYGCCSRG